MTDYIALPTAGEPCGVHRVVIAGLPTLHFVQSAREGLIFQWPGTQPDRLEFQGWVEQRTDQTRRLTALRDGITSADDEVIGQAISRPDGQLDWLTLPTATPRGLVAQVLIGTLHRHVDREGWHQPGITRVDVGDGLLSWHCVSDEHTVRGFLTNTWTDPDTDEVLGWTLAIRGDLHGRLEIPAKDDAWWWPAHVPPLRPTPWPHEATALFDRIIADLRD